MLPDRECKGDGRGGRAEERDRRDGGHGTKLTGLKKLIRLHHTPIGAPALPPAIPHSLSQTQSCMVELGAFGSVKEASWQVLLSLGGMQPGGWMRALVRFVRAIGAVGREGVGEGADVGGEEELEKESLE